MLEGFEIGIKVGLSYGQVDWGIVGREHKAFYFRGKAIDNCAGCEHYAESGDIVFDDGGIYGDGVNIASRLESISIPGGILISEKLQDELNNHPDLQTELIGKFLLKNVKQN